MISATLSGAAAVPKGAAAGKGTATITLNTRSGRACWRLTVSGIDKPLSAHIHQGAVGKVGQVVIPLGDRFSRKGCVLSVPRALRLVAAAPTDYYVDVHTTKFLDGAVRGQLRGASGLTPDTGRLAPRVTRGPGPKTHPRRFLRFRGVCRTLTGRFRQRPLLSHS